MENKITTTDALLNVQRKMSDETFAKQFNFLFAKYIDIKNKDKNAFYHKLLQHLTSAGLTKEEATDFLKDIRVKNADLIQKIEETQAKIKESSERFEKARFDLLTNPLSAKNYLILFAETIKEINLTLDNIMDKQMLNVINKQHFADKVNEIKKLLEHSEQSISEKLKQDKDPGIDDVMLLQETKVTFNKVAEKLNEMTAELAINKTLTQNVNIDKDVKIEGQVGKEKEVENPQALAETESPEKDAYMLSDAIYKAELQLNTPNTQFDNPDYNEKLAYLALINYAADKEALRYDTINFLEEENHNLYLIKKIAATEVLTNPEFKETFEQLKKDFNIAEDKTLDVMTQAAKNLQNRSVPLNEYNKQLLEEMLKIDNNLNINELKDYFVNNSYLIEEKDFNDIVQSIPQQQQPARTETESPQKEQRQSLEDIAFAARDKFLDENKDLEKELINSLEAVYSDLFFKDNNIDEKTMNFLVLSEYLHAYNNFPLDEVYAKFDKIFDKDEFKAIVIYNNALMNNDVDDLFDFVVEQDFEAANIKEYAKMLKHNFPEYKQLDEQIEKELEEKDKDKELEIGIPSKNKKFKGMEIG